MKFQKRWARANCAMPEIPDLLFPRKEIIDGFWYECKPNPIVPNEV